MIVIMFIVMFAPAICLAIFWGIRKYRSSKVVDDEPDIIYVQYRGETLPMTKEQKVMLWDVMGREARNTYVEEYRKRVKKGEYKREKQPDGSYKTFVNGK